MNFIKNQWLAGVIIIIWILASLHSRMNDHKLLDEANHLKVEVDSLQNVSAQKAKQIDSLSKVDTVIVDKIKTIKEKEYVEIKVIDSLPISGLQQFFTDRYER
jgi:cell division protein FtsB